MFNAWASLLEFAHSDHGDSDSLAHALNTGCIFSGRFNPAQVRWLVVIRPLQGVSIYLHQSPVGMCKSIDRLAAIVQQEM